MALQGVVMRSFFSPLSLLLLSRVQGKPSTARIPTKSAGFVTPSLPEEKPFLEATEVSCSVQSLGPPAALAPLPQPQHLPLAVPDCAPGGSQAEIPTLVRPKPSGAFSFES